jgi:hypothetical protein
MGRVNFEANLRSRQTEFRKTVLPMDALYKGHQITKISRRKSKLENPI